MELTPIVKAIIDSWSSEQIYYMFCLKPDNDDLIDSGETKVYIRDIVEQHYGIINTVCLMEGFDEEEFTRLGEGNE